MIYKLIKYKFLILTVILGAILRLYNLGFVSLNWDEAAWGYNAYSVMLTGKDEYSKSYPIFTRSFDEYKSTLPMYLMIPSIKIFGLNEVGVRFPSAIIGVFSILLIYFLSKEFVKDERVALLSSFIFAISPWSVHLSRVYPDANEAMFLLLLGIYLFIKSKLNHKLLILSVFCFMLSMFTYNANKIISPIILCLMIIGYRKTLIKINRKIKYTAFFVGLIFILLFIYLAVIGQAFARVATTNIFTLWKDEYFPKIFYFAWDIIGRYVGYFSFYNLFLREPLEPSTIVAGNSIFFASNFIPWIIGMYYMITKKTCSKVFKMILFVLPLPAILTWNWFQPGRVMALFAFFTILIGIGINEIIKKFPKRYFIMLCAFVVVWGMLDAFYLFDSLNVYLPFRDNGNYQPGFKETVPLVLKNSDNFDKVIIDTPHAQPYIFYLFYGAYDPDRYQKELDLDYIGTPRKHFDFGKFHFRKINWEVDKDLKNTLFVKDNFDGKAKIIGESKDKYGNTINQIAATGD